MIDHDETSASNANMNNTTGNQSPINIDERTAIPKVFPPLVMSGHTEATTKMTLINTGHTAEIRPAIGNPGAFLSGGPLKDKYKFLQLHFHWGSKNEIGSEHSINGNFYSMEVHFVHYNQKYQNIEESCKKPDGLAVVAIFLQLNSKSKNEDHSEIGKITNHLSSTKAAGATVDIPSDVLAWVKDYCSGCSYYYTYSGSLTTPPFTENVTWLIYPVPIKISKRQIDSFRQLNSPVGHKITSNHRQIQLLSGREVYLVENTTERKNKDEDHGGKANLPSTVDNIEQMSSSSSRSTKICSFFCFR